MYVAPSPRRITSHPIRKLDVSRDLNPVADLIEQCFPIQQDQDGQTYIRQMRKAARELQFLRWASSLSELGNKIAAGFVWEEGGRIVGNLSLIRFQEGRSRVHLIANVAVHPDYRRRGIGRALTTRALHHLRRVGDTRAWLQVREDNRVAYDLYRSLGFEERFVRTTWRIRPCAVRTGQSPGGTGLRIRRRRRSEWNQQKGWLDQTYPAGMRWNLPVDFSRLGPQPLDWLESLLGGERFRHWAFEQQGDLAGLVSWQKTDSYANNLWLAFPPETESETLPPALRLALQKLPRKHPLSVNYPAGRCVDGLESLGFKAFRTLVWMSCRLTRT
jgi:ribosomal protein S18 acetylase RimI-like enzyme